MKTIASAAAPTSSHLDEDGSALVDSLQQQQALRPDHRSGTATRFGVRKSEQLQHSLNRMTSIVLEQQHFGNPLNSIAGASSSTSTSAAAAAHRIEGFLSKVLEPSPNTAGASSSSDGMNDDMAMTMPIITDITLATVNNGNQQQTQQKSSSSGGKSRSPLAKQQHQLQPSHDHQNHQQAAYPHSTIITQSNAFTALPSDYRDVLLAELANHKRILDEAYHEKEAHRIAELEEVRRSLETMAVKVHEGTVGLVQQTKALEEREQRLETHRMKLTTEYEAYMAEQAHKHKVVLDTIALEKDQLAVTVREREMTLQQTQTRLVLMEKEYDALQASIARFQKKDDAHSVAVDAAQDELKAARATIRALSEASEAKDREVLRCQNEKEASDKACQYYLAQLRDCIAKYQLLEKRVAEAESERFQKDREELAERTRKFESDRQIAAAVGGIGLGSGGDVRPSTVLADQFLANLKVTNALKAKAAHLLLTGAAAEHGIGNAVVNASPSLSTPTTSGAVVSAADVAYAIGDDVALLKEIVSEIKSEVKAKEDKVKKEMADERRRDERERIAIVYASGYAHPLSGSPNALGNANHQQVIVGKKKEGQSSSSHLSDRATVDGQHDGRQRRTKTAGTRANSNRRLQVNKKAMMMMVTDTQQGGGDNRRAVVDVSSDPEQHHHNRVNSDVLSYDTQSIATSTTNFTYIDPDTLSQYDEGAVTGGGSTTSGGGGGGGHNRNVSFDDELLLDYDYVDEEVLLEHPPSSTRARGQQQHRPTATTGPTTKAIKKKTVSSHHLSQQQQQYNSRHGSSNHHHMNMMLHNSPPQSSQLLDISISTMSSYADAPIFAHHYNNGGAPLTPREMLLVHRSSATHTPTGGLNTTNSNTSSNLGGNNNTVVGSVGSTTTAPTSSSSSAATLNTTNNNNNNNANVINNTDFALTLPPSTTALMTVDNNQQQSLSPPAAAPRNNNSVTSNGGHYFFNPYLPQQQQMMTTGGVPIVAPLGALSSSASATMSHQQHMHHNISLSTVGTAAASQSNRVHQHNNHNNNVMNTTTMLSTPNDSVLNTTTDGSRSGAQQNSNMFGTPAGHRTHNTTNNNNSSSSSVHRAGNSPPSASPSAGHVITSLLQRSNLKGSSGVEGRRSSATATTGSSAAAGTNAVKKAAATTAVVRTTTKATTNSRTADSNSGDIDHSGLVVTGVGISNYVPSPTTSRPSSAGRGGGGNSSSGNVSRSSTPQQGGGGAGGGARSRPTSANSNTSHRNGRVGSVAVAGGFSPTAVVVSPMTSAGNTPTDASAAQHYRQQQQLAASSSSPNTSTNNIVNGSGPFGFKSYYVAPPPMTATTPSAQLASHFGANRSAASSKSSPSPTATTRGRAGEQSLVVSPLTPMGPFNLASTNSIVMAMRQQQQQQSIGGSSSSRSIRPSSSSAVDNKTAPHAADGVGSAQQQQTSALPPSSSSSLPFPSATSSAAAAVESIATFLDSLKASKAQLLATSNYSEDDALIREMTAKIETYSKFLEGGRFP